MGYRPKSLTSLHPNFSSHSRHRKPPPTIKNLPSITQPFQLIPLFMPLRISFTAKPTLSRSTSLFLSFCNRERLEKFRYHYASNNNQLLNFPRLIRNQQDLDTLLNFLASQDFPSHLKDQCPNTKWVIERILSLRIHHISTRKTPSPT